MASSLIIDIRSRVSQLPLTVGVSGLVLVVGTMVAAAVSGGTAALGVAGGVLLVLVSYVASTLAIAWADTVNPRLVFAVGMGMYIAKFSLFGGLLLVINGAGWAGATAMAVGIVAGVLAWTSTQIWWTVRHPPVRS